MISPIPRVITRWFARGVRSQGEQSNIRPEMGLDLPETWLLHSRFVAGTVNAARQESSEPTRLVGLEWLPA